MEIGWLPLAEMWSLMIQWTTSFPPAGRVRAARGRETTEQRRGMWVSSNQWPPGRHGGRSGGFARALTLLIVLASATATPTPAPTFSDGHYQGVGWCGGLDLAIVGTISSLNECYEACVDEYGVAWVVAVDYWSNSNSCYCQDACDCMEDVGDSDVFLATVSGLQVRH